MSVIPSLVVEHTVYWLYDSEDRCLYIGCSRSLRNRLITHRRDSRWWRQVARMETVVYPSEAEARDAERRAIFAEQPSYNVNSRRLTPRMRQHLRRAA